MKMVFENKNKNLIEQVLKKYDEKLYELYTDILMELSNDDYNELLKRIKNKHGLGDYYITDFNELEDYLYWVYIVECILNYCDEEELKKLLEG